MSSTVTIQNTKSCKKLTFESQEAAIEYKVFANKRGMERQKGLPGKLRSFKRLTHAYKCMECNNFHLTSMSNTGIRKMKERALYGLRYNSSIF